MTTDDDRSITTEDAAEPDPAAADAAPTDDADAKPKNKRRKRSGKKKPAAADDDSAPASGDADDETRGGHTRDDTDRPARPTGDDESNGGTKKKRRRRKRGGKRAREERERRAAEEGLDVDADHRAPRERQIVDPSTLENWEEVFEKRTFADLGIRSSVVRGVEEIGFKHPTKIQAEMIPPILEGRDVLGQSRTGSGKTAAFGLPLFNLIKKGEAFQVIILAPTRELAIQIADEIADLGRHTPIRIATVYGGQPIPTQARALERNPEVVVATPGRFLDMKQRGYLHLHNVRIAILDEVDRMLDIGFRDEIKKILSAIDSGGHQTVFVSATISDDIEKLARSFMTDPVKLQTTGGSLTVSLVEQHYLTVQPWDKRRLLRHLLTHEEPELTLVFCRMKRTVDDIARYLNDKGIEANAIHGDMFQGKRNAVMKRLRAGQLSVIVASDLAARGLDVDNISHVINYDLPDDPEVYVHRIGRTARAGRNGVAWSFVTPEQGPLLTEIEKLANIHIPHLEYPDFQPGPVPERVKAEQQAEAKRITALKSRSRFSDGSPPPAVVGAADPSKFPGGIVPTKMPPKRLGGRVKTARSMRNAPAPQAAPDDADKKTD